ncbi:MAG: DegV family protein [Lachnospiraceae bacterium]|nr:DegV family protein [Lachnospiraceae bacterium]
MKCNYVGDSCCELPLDFKESHDFALVPLTIEVGDYVIKDDENFNQKEFLQKVADYPKYPKSSCPSPESFAQAFGEGYDCIFVSTLSAPLSGSYNSACLAKSLYLETHPDAKVHVFNSMSASGGEAQVLMYAASQIEAGKSFEETVEATERFVEGLRTFFVLDSLEALEKNGRLSRLKMVAATAFNIKLVCTADRGTIVQMALARGMNRALDKMVELSLKELKSTADKTLFVTHCNCKARAEEVVKKYLAKASFKKTYVLDMAGISSLYACDGGIIVTA